MGSGQLFIIIFIVVTAGIILILVYGDKLFDFVQSIKALGDNKAKSRLTNNQTEIKIPEVKQNLINQEQNNTNKTGLTEQKADWREQKTDLNLKTEKLEATGKAVFGTIPMPDRPDIANLIVGMATDIEGKIIDGVIIEIQDEHGSPLRVIKTNSLGQFKISTPLSSGRYLIIADKEGYSFDRVNVDLNGQIVEPIRIIAHN
jgi:hypothetical protein